MLYTNWLLSASFIDWRWFFWFDLPTTIKLYAG